MNKLQSGSRCLLLAVGAVLLAVSMGLCFLWVNGRFGTAVPMWVVWISVPVTATGLTLIILGSKHRNIAG